ncbi:MAG: hypothetical protein CL949_03175 [Erythrobacter sp.]|jgi:hypothetical protein|nr:hypothetical protein [Erythrobacter sp.]|tara:strand:- start:95 stop:496 length:402 start_codon:yes stop_codon:yes gene_type:complete
MLNDEHKPEAIRNFCTAIANLARELIEAGGVTHSALAAGLRVEAGKIEVAGPRDPMSMDEREMVDLARKAHEFINSLMVAGVDERIAVVTIGNTLVERVARTRGAAGAAHWLRGLATLVDQNGDAIEETSKAH